MSATAENPGFAQTFGNAIRKPEALQKAADITANLAGHAVAGWDKAQEPGKASMVVGVADFVEGAATELAPFAGEAPQDSLRARMYDRFDRLKGLATPENVDRLVGCAAAVRAGVEYVEAKMA